MGNKKRLDIVLADLISLIFDLVLRGPLEKFRSISVKKLSKSIVSSSIDYKAGIYVYESKDLQKQNNINLNIIEQLSQKNFLQ